MFKTKKNFTIKNISELYPFIHHGYDSELQSIGVLCTWGHLEDGYDFYDDVYTYQFCNKENEISHRIYDKYGCQIHLIKDSKTDQISYKVDAIQTLITNKLRDEFINEIF